MNEIWGQITAWLTTNTPELKNALRKGASQSALKTAEKALGVSLPAEVRDYFAIHDGQSESVPPLLGDWSLLPLKQVVAQWRIEKKLLDDGVFVDAEAEPSKEVQQHWWHPRWIPVCTNGAGDLYCIDLEPTEKGKSGQIILVGHSEAKRSVVASGIKELLHDYADDLKKGKMVFADGQFTKK